MATGISHFSAKANFSINTKPKLGLSSPRYMPRVIAVEQYKSYWASIEAQIETYLREAIPIRPPESVFEPMHHLAFAAPRTTAPALCVAACELVGGDRRQVLAAASAIHLMHATAYTHENLLLTDRPRPKAKHKYSPNVELLTGDGILPFGLQLLAGSQNDPARILRVVVEMTRAYGSQGQGVVDKEGKEHGCGAACGAILGGGADEEIEKLRNFGVYAGMVQGMLAEQNPAMKARIEQLKELALKELRSFKGNAARLDLISTLVLHCLSL